MERGEAFLEAESWEVDVLKALIFDMDGVLIDTEPLYFEAYRKAAESYGREYDLTLHRRIMGIPERDGLRLIVEHLGIEASLDEFRERVHVERRRVTGRRRNLTEGSTTSRSTGGSWGYPRGTVCG